MDVLRSVPELKTWRLTRGREGRRVSFVPTMGYLHAGHQALIQRASADGSLVVVSIFVNPLQFGPNEDFERYPRDEVGDLARIAEVAPHAAVFLPSVSDMYPPGFVTRVDVAGVTERLCGRSRPGHFRGVATVVARLFGLVAPDVAYFGQKDYQQVATLRAMVRDLALPVEVVGVPTVREADGLALSSRNVYLSPRERVAALCLSRGLAAADALWRSGERDPGTLVQALRAPVEAEPLARLDYAEILDVDSLQDPQPGRPVVAALAVFFERARLIDNHVLGTS